MGEQVSPPQLIQIGCRLAERGVLVPREEAPCEVEREREIPQRLRDPAKSRVTGGHIRPEAAQELDAHRTLQRIQWQRLHPEDRIPTRSPARHEHSSSPRPRAPLIQQLLVLTVVEDEQARQRALPGLLH